MKYTDNTSLPIGIFDSGVGGLTVLYEISRLLPKESFIYYADSLHTPYGTKTPLEIIQYSIDIVETLLQEGVKFIIIACNTASGIVLEALEKKYPHVHFIGMINSGAQAIHKKNITNIALLATESTIQQGFYNTILMSQKPYRIQNIACPMLVSLAENGESKGSKAKETVLEYISKLKEETEGILLGCTHFPLFQPFFEEYLESNIDIINPAYTLALEVKEYMTTYMLLHRKEKKNNKFIVTGDKRLFSYIYTQFFGNTISF